LNIFKGNILFRYFLLVLPFAFIFSKDNNLISGIEYYKNRAENSSGIVAKSDPIEKAIQKFHLAKTESELEASIYLLRCYYYKGKYVSKTDDDKKTVFNQGKSLAEEMIKKYPQSAAMRYWYLVNLGSWSEVYGILAAAREGVADLMKTHSEKIIEIDKNYGDGGGYFMLGAVHFKSPYIPFILSWPDNDEAIINLRLAYQTGDQTPTQTVYLARALYKDGQNDEAIEILNKLILQPLSKDELVEDTEQHTIAKGLLADWE
tara:strand:+ start:4579 stop:5361 length:783 start_codon:yes stop_codon:yes gene_type:complete